MSSPEHDHAIGHTDGSESVALVTPDLKNIPENDIEPIDAETDHMGLAREGEEG